LFYSTITSYLGFAVNDGEYKVMGLAPYGRPRYLREMGDVVHAVPGGGFRLNLDYFDFTRSDRMYADALIDLLGVAPRRRGEPITADHQDIARSAQITLEEILLSEVRHLHDLVPVDNLCMAGGVALNCVANGRIRREGPFKRLFVQPAAGDAGGALGAAALAHVRTGGEEPIATLEHAYLGPQFTADEVVAAWEGTAARLTDYSRREADLLADVADRIAAGQVIGWCDGRMEFGPRALGARSILADPRDPSMRDRLNALVKKREGFRPFAPAVLEHELGAHFDLDRPSPFMLDTAQTTSAIALPAVTHVDGSARVQTVSRDTAPRFAGLLEAFQRRTGCPVLLNTSFNLADEPIVCSPVDALISFGRSQLDALVFGDALLDRRDLPAQFVEECQVVDPPRPTGMGDAIYTFA
jgi:carbamoyltransferase